MKVIYVTKNLPFGPDEAFIFSELTDHLQAGWDVSIVPVRKGPLIHDEGRSFLSRTWARGLIDRTILKDFIAEFLRHPFCVTRALVGTIDLRRPALWPRNMAVWAKGVWLARAARRWQAEHFHVHWIAVPATMALIAARVSGLPFSITAHRYDIAQGNLVATKASHACFVRAIDQAGVAELSAQMTSGAAAPCLVRMGVTFPATPVHLRPASLTRLHAIIGARMVEKKGHATLFHAIAAARRKGVDVALDILGDGPLENGLRRLAGELGINDLVTFTGVVSHGTLMNRLNSGNYDLAVLPSVTALDGDKEGIPVFLMEAMGAGLPVIATPNGGIQELVAEGCGILVPERDSLALAQAMIQLARDDGLRLTLAAAGRAQVIREFNLDRTGRQLREMISAAGDPSCRSPS